LVEEGGEDGAAGDVVRDFDAAVVFFDDGFGDGEAESEAEMGAVFGGEAGIEDFGAELIGDAGAGILDLDPDPVRGLGAAGDFEGAGIAHGFASIEDEVGPDLVDFDREAVDRRDGGEIDFEGEFFEDVAEEQDRILEAFADIGGFFRGAVLAAVIFEATDHGADARGGDTDAAQEDSHFEEVDEAFDEGKAAVFGLAFDEAEDFVAVGGFELSEGAYDGAWEDGEPGLELFAASALFFGLEGFAVEAEFEGAFEEGEKTFFEGSGEETVELGFQRIG
jgi:hypothetical protein